jgi:Fur family zinc uptake transcriptional regulator
MAKKIVIQDFVADRHNHAHCVEDAITEAQAICDLRKERFTDLRKTVLELVWKQHKPVKAYDLLAQLAEFHERPAPPTVYRALDFLREAGLVHKIQSLNAYVGCGDPGRSHGGQFLICEQCGDVAELDDETVSARIAVNANKIGFKVKDETIEVLGLCARCQ